LKLTKLFYNHIKQKLSDKNILLPLGYKIKQPLSTPVNLQNITVYYRNRNFPIKGKKCPPSVHALKVFVRALKVENFAK